MPTIPDLSLITATPKKWQQHTFIILITSVLAVSCTLVAVSLRLYVTSGASQVDISKPALQSVREQAAEDAKKSSNDSFPANGKLDETSLNDFRRSYGNHVTQIAPGNHFSPDAVSPENLQLFVDPAATATP